MKKFLKVFSVVLCLGLVLVSTGCFSKKTITSSKFKSVAESHKLTVTDVKQQFASVSYINEALVARSEKGYQLEFYVLSTKEDAISFFTQNKTIFEQAKDGASAETNMNGQNYEKYTLVVDGKYKLLSRVENTVLYLNIDDVYKDEVKKIVDELKY